MVSRSHNQSASEGGLPPPIQAYHFEMRGLPLRLTLALLAFTSVAVVPSSALAHEAPPNCVDWPDSNGWSDPPADKSCTLYTNTHATSNATAGLQGILKALSGFTGFTGARDGIFGNATKSGVEFFQLTLGLPYDGVVRQEEWKELRDQIFYVDTDGTSNRYHAGAVGYGYDNFYRRISSGRWFIEDSSYQGFNLCCLVGLRTHVHTI